uniref:Uncharacterized protein n=1 Tax=Sphaerodactylus townsendi TaxID=933632 RepID=A0ACB8E7R4_9SAUR
MSAAVPQPPLRGAEKSGAARLPEENRQDPLLCPSGRVGSEAPRQSGSGEGEQQQQQPQEDDEDDDHHKRPRGRHLVDAPPPKDNPWTRWKPPPAVSSVSPSSASTGSELALQDPGELVSFSSF